MLGLVEYNDRVECVAKMMVDKNFALVVFGDLEAEDVLVLAVGNLDLVDNLAIVVRNRQLETVVALAGCVTCQTKQRKGRS